MPKLSSFRTCFKLSGTLIIIEPGMADILAFTTIHIGERDYSGQGEITYSEPLWIEVKTPKGTQSEFQRSFQAQVEAHGHRYIIARCVEDVARWVE